MQYTHHSEDTHCYGGVLASVMSCIHQKARSAQYFLLHVFHRSSFTLFYFHDQVCINGSSFIRFSNFEWKYDVAKLIHYFFKEISMFIERQMTRLRPLNELFEDEILLQPTQHFTHITVDV